SGVSGSREVGFDVAEGTAATVDLALVSVGAGFFEGACCAPPVDVQRAMSTRAVPDSQARLVKGMGLIALEYVTQREEVLPVIGQPQAAVRPMTQAELEAATAAPEIEADAQLPGEVPVGRVELIDFGLVRAAEPDEEPRPRRAEELPTARGGESPLRPRDPPIGRLALILELLASGHAEDAELVAVLVPRERDGNDEAAR